MHKEVQVYLKIDGKISVQRVISARRQARGVHAVY